MRSVPAHLVCPEEGDALGLQQVRSTLISHLCSYPHNSPTSFARLVIFFFIVNQITSLLFLESVNSFLLSLDTNRRSSWTPSLGEPCLCCVTLQRPPAPRLPRGSSWATECGGKHGSASSESRPQETLRIALAICASVPVRRHLQLL